MDNRLRPLIRSAAVVARRAVERLSLPAVALILLLAWLRGCWPFVGNDQTKSTEPLKTSVTEWLDYCFPFEALNGQRMLTFTVEDRSVIAAEALEDERAKGAFFAAHPHETKGAWVADEETHRVSVEIDGSKSEYTLLVPFGRNQCILVSGSLSGADLTNSMFATPDFRETER
jgi:hypothetical protein